MPRMTGGDAIVDSCCATISTPCSGCPACRFTACSTRLRAVRDRLRLIHVRHEQTAGYMAVGAATSTGRAAVYTVVPGPGVLNTTAALATAWALNAPVLCLTGQVPSAMIGRRRGALHELPDQLGTLRGLVKFAARIGHPAEAPALVARAFQEMRSGRPGPAVLEMPMDQFGAVAEVAHLDPLPLLPPPPVDAEVIERAAALVAGARAPMIWVGGGARHADREILPLAERIGAPVVSLRTGRGIVDDDHPLGLTVPAGHALWPGTDLLVGFGSRLDVPVQRWRGAGCPVVRIDIDPAEQRRLKVDLFVLADAAAAAGALAAAAAPRHDAARVAAIAAAKASAVAASLKVQPQMSFLAAIRAALPREGILCDEMTQVGYTSWFGFPVHHPRGLVISGFSGTLGAGFPMALGVKAANPEAGGGGGRRWRVPVRRHELPTPATTASRSSPCSSTTAPTATCCATSARCSTGGRPAWRSPTRISRLSRAASACRRGGSRTPTGWRGARGSARHGRSRARRGDDRGRPRGIAVGDTLPQRALIAGAPDAGRGGVGPLAQSRQ